MTELEVDRLFAAQDWQTIADQIDTGTDNPENSRALVVFNPTGNPIGGTAVFHVDMPWREARELPGIRVTHLSTVTASPICITQPVKSNGRISFAIYFQTQMINRWDTYIAEYADKQSLSDSSLIDTVIDSFQVFETTRHVGIFPWSQ